MDMCKLSVNSNPGQHVHAKSCETNHNSANGSRMFQTLWINKICVQKTLTFWWQASARSQRNVCRPLCGQTLSSPPSDLSDNSQPQLARTAESFTSQFIVRHGLQTLYDLTNIIRSLENISKISYAHTSQGVFMQKHRGKHKNQATHVSLTLSLFSVLRGMSAR